MLTVKVCVLHCLAGRGSGIGGYRDMVVQADAIKGAGTYAVWRLHPADYQVFDAFPAVSPRLYNALVALARRDPRLC